MAQFPYIPFYTADFISDTIQFSSAQTGAHIMLLLAAWRSPDCKLPDDDKQLARIARMDSRTWRLNKKIIMGLWKKDDQQKWYQGRLLDERKNVVQLRSKNVRAGTSSALKRKERHSTSVENKFNQNSTISNLNLNVKEDLIRSGEISIQKVNIPDDFPISLSALRQAAKISNDGGIEGGIENGLELANIFLGWVKEFPKKPDSAFLSWVPNYLIKQKN